MSMKVKADDLLMFTAQHLSIGRKQSDDYIIKYPNGKVIAFLSQNFKDIQFGTANGTWYRPTNTLVVPVPSGIKNIKVQAIYADVVPNAIFTAYNIALTEAGIPIWLYINDSLKLDSITLRVMITGEYDQLGGGIG